MCIQLVNATGYFQPLQTGFSYPGLDSSTLLSLLGLGRVPCLGVFSLGSAVLSQDRCKKAER